MIERVWDRDLVKRSNSTIHNIYNEREVAFVKPSIGPLHRSISQNRACEFEQSHVRPAPWPVNLKEA